MTTADRKLRVFLCHSSQDKPIVRELYQRLLAEGWIDPWLDEEKLLPGVDWDMEIEKAAESSNAVLVCLSQNAVTKEGYIQKEIKVALNLALYKPEGTIYIIPLRLDDCTVPWSIKSIQYIDCFPSGQFETAYERVLGSLEARAYRLGIDIAEMKEYLRREEEEKTKRESEERIRKEVIEKVRSEEEEKLRREAEEQARATIIEEARKLAEDQARQAEERKDRLKKQKLARKKAEERAHKATEEQIRIQPNQIISEKEYLAAKSPARTKIEEIVVKSTPRIFNQPSLSKVVSIGLRVGLVCIILDILAGSILFVSGIFIASIISGAYAGYLTAKGMSSRVLLSETSRFGAIAGATSGIPSVIGFIAAAMINPPGLFDWSSVLPLWLIWILIASLGGWVTFSFFPFNEN